MTRASQDELDVFFLSFFLNKDFIYLIESTSSGSSRKKEKPVPC